MISLGQLAAALLPDAQLPEGLDLTLPHASKPRKKSTTPTKPKRTAKPSQSPQLPSSAQLVYPPSQLPDTEHLARSSSALSTSLAPALSSSAVPSSAASLQSASSAEDEIIARLLGQTKTGEYVVEARVLHANKLVGSGVATRPHPAQAEEAGPYFLFVDLCFDGSFGY